MLFWLMVYTEGTLGLMMLFCEGSCLAPPANLMLISEDFYLDSGREGLEGWLYTNLS